MDIDDIEIRRDSVNHEIQVELNSIANEDSVRSNSQDNEVKRSPFQKNLCKPIRLKSRQEQKFTATPTRANHNGNDVIQTIETDRNDNQEIV